MLKATANWLAQVDYDIATAEQMLRAGRYIYVIFMSHMALEKALKALVTEETQQLPPRTHNLIHLAQRAQVACRRNSRNSSGSSTIPVWSCDIQMISRRWSPSTLKPLPKTISSGRRSCIYGYAKTRDYRPHSPLLRPTLSAGHPR